MKAKSVKCSARDLKKILPDIKDEKIYKKFKKSIEEEFSQISVDMSDETFLMIAKQAHENRITFDEQVAIILTEQLKREGKL